MTTDRIADEIYAILDGMDLSMPDRAALEQVSPGPIELTGDDVPKVMMEMMRYKKAKDAKSLIKLLSSLAFTVYTGDNLVRIKATGEVMPYTEWLKLAPGPEQFPPEMEFLY